MNQKDSYVNVFTTYEKMKILLVSICTSVNVCVYTYEYCAHGGQKQVWDYWSLRLQVVIIHMMWALGTKLRPK